MTTTDTSAMRPLLFPDDGQFWYETLRALGHTPYGGADVGEVVTTAARISAGDYGSWYEQWAATAQRTEAEARAQLAVGHRVSGRDGLLRAATYWRSAEFFTRDTALAPWQGWAGLWNGDLPQAEHVSQQGPSRRTAHRAGAAAGKAAAPRTRHRQPRSSAAALSAR